MIQRVLLALILVFATSQMTIVQRVDQPQKRLGEALYEKVKDQLDYFPYDSTYRIIAQFDPSISTNEPFTLPVSSGKPTYFMEYGRLHFTLNKAKVQLTVYRPWPITPLNRYMLFLPFSDLSRQDSTYPAGRYLPISMDDVTDEGVRLDFNAATNPLCAYDDGYACPLPPKPNQLTIRIHAGEKRLKGKM